MATHSSVLAWRIPWTGAWWATVHRVTKSWTRLKWHSTQMERPGGGEMLEVAECQAEGTTDARTSSQEHAWSIQ